MCNSLSLAGHADLVVSVAVVGVEVEDEDERPGLGAPVKHHHLVALVLQAHEVVAADEPRELILQLVHGRIEGAHVLVP